MPESCFIRPIKLGREVLRYQRMRISSRWFPALHTIEGEIRREVGDSKIASEESDR
jgi:hypothetical protein